LKDAATICFLVTVQTLVVIYHTLKVHKASAKSKITGSPDAHCILETACRISIKFGIAYLIWYCVVQYSPLALHYAKIELGLFF
jgi:hypothetical protein